jgi:UDP-glucose-4-epimerase GalE
VEAIVVAGGAGYIGSHVCKALAGAGYLPVAFDNLSNGHRWAVRWGPLEIGDLADRSRLDACFLRYRPLAVIHLAGFIAAGESVVNPAKFYDNNLRGMLCLLESMRANHVNRIVFSSSAAVYGTPAAVPIGEDAPFAAVNPYGRTKAMGEEILRDYASAYGLRPISLRYFNASGADPEGELGEAHEPETHLIPLVLEAAAGLRPAIDVFGENYPTRDGTCERDYVHVADLAEAHVLALKRSGFGAGAEAYNLGNGRGFTVLEVIKAAERVTGHRIVRRSRPIRAGDPAVLVADGSRAVAELAWRRRYGDLDTQIAHAWRWLIRQGQPVLAPSAAFGATASSQRP